MSLSRTLFVGLLGCILSACADVESSATVGNDSGEESTEVATSSPSQKSNLDSSILAEKERLGARGDADAAMDVASHYSNAPGDQDKVRFWLVIAAENGSALAMHLLSGELFKEGGQVNCERAIYWLNHLSQQKEYVDGHPVPGFIEKEIGEVQAAGENCQQG